MADVPNLRDLRQLFAAAGRIEAIFIRPGRHERVFACTQARAEPGRGIVGDHRASVVRMAEQARKRELTLLQYEHIDAVAKWSGIDSLDASRLRRNLVVSGINLASMRSPFPDVRIEWAIGDDVRIEVTGSCDPCSRMEDELGPGGYNAMRGHGGVTARVSAGGILRVGDPVVLAGVRHLARGST